jgi:hypothetical protein
MIGAVGVYRSISTGSASGWVRQGFYGIVIGTTMFTISTSIGLAGADASADWIAADYSIAVTLSAVGTYILYMFIIVYWLARVSLGNGMVLGGVHHQMVELAHPHSVGSYSGCRGRATENLNDLGRVLHLIFAALAGLTTPWFLVLGVWITRKT